MDLSPQITKRIGNEVVRPGLRLDVPSPLHAHAVKVNAVCDSVSPELWHGEVVAFGQTVIKTGSYDNDGQAAKAASNALVAKLLKLLQD